MRIDVLTIFPDYLAPVREALLGKAIDRGRISVGVHDLREWTHDVHRSVDDSPYGGGPGMVMKPSVWGEALDSVCAEAVEQPRLVVPTPAGVTFDQPTARRWSGEQHLVFACGRYEGIDQRVIDDAARRMPVEEVSIGDYVLVGGEVATLTMIEAVVRLLPGVLGNPASAEQDSFSDGLLEGPCYTRPETWRGLPVPEVLRSGDHAAVGRWQRDRALERTASRRPDLIDALDPEQLDDRDRSLLTSMEDSEAIGPRAGAESTEEHPDPPGGGTSET
ncbi:tRNA (guanosine(37)-N1)-methyltransferase TrmD [Actinopolyspora halophila]|uniref:tRNA (guanosine(37)-N1)-methyltransferase TrmD n=1 Tax=Actinopolyspora halophila TaxID=1850 RepID=UPI000381C657|nr:tRNA (guanosine(37)-N1)-methyltransferase TrmD [Actinopolyspora halophila]